MIAAGSPTFVRGNGGKVRKTTATARDLDIEEWTMAKTSRLQETTHSGTSGWAKYTGTVKEWSGSVKASFSSDDMIDTTIVMDIGTEVAVELHLGNSGKFYAGTVVIETINHQVNNQTGVVKYDFTFKGISALTNPT